MPDFTPAEIDLARQLALPREFRTGDWVIGRGRYAGTTFAWADWSDPYPIHGDTAALANRGVEGAEWVWLPSIEDCFELLREAGGDGWLDTLLEQHTCAPAEKPWFASALWMGDRHAGFGDTPREALYRLLLEVRG